MPNGRLALAEPDLLDRIDTWMSKPVSALGALVEPVGRNVEVTLLLRTDAGAQTSHGRVFTNDQGGYLGLRLPTGLTIAPNDGRFLVSVGTETDNTRTRAFVCNASSQQNTNIDYRSEAAVRVILNKLATTPSCKLSNFSAQEICGIVDRIYEMDGTVSGLTAAALNLAATDAATADSQVQFLLDQACDIFNTPTPRAATKTPPTPPTSTPVNTNTPVVVTATPINTQPTVVGNTATPTATTPPAATPTATPTGLHVNVGEGVADSQGNIPITTSLLTGTSAVGGVQNDILFDNRIVRLDGASSCVINPAISDRGAGCEEDPVQGPCKTLSRQLSVCGSTPQPPGCPENAGPEISRFRGIIAATAVPNANTIPSGALYTCNFKLVNRDLLPAVLTNSNVVVSDPLGKRIGGVNTANGLITDGTTPPTSTPTNTPVTPVATPTTPVVEPTATNTPITPISTATNTPVPPTATNTPITPTATFTSTPTNTATPTSAIIHIDAGMANGPRGGIVNIPVTLTNGTGRVVATSTDLTYNPTQVRVVLLNGAPDCTIADDIKVGTSADKMLVSGTLNGQATEILRVGVVSFKNPEQPIRDGLLFTCKFQINQSATAGQMLDNLSKASDENGNEIGPVESADGAIGLEGTLPLIVVGNSMTSAGSQVSIPVNLVGGGQAISAVAVDIVYDSAKVTVGEVDSDPDCNIDSTLGGGTTANKQLFSEIVPLNGTQRRLRVGIAGIEAPMTAIPDGPLFQCRFNLSASASGDVLLDASGAVADMQGVDSPADAADGTIEIVP